MGKCCKGFVLGVVVGAIGALLLAPKSGKEMRKDLLTKTEDLKLKLEELNSLEPDELRSVIADKIKEIRKSIENFDWKASKDCMVRKFEEMKQELSDIQISIDVDLGKKSDAPVISAVPTPEAGGVAESLDTVIENINSKYDD